MSYINSSNNLFVNQPVTTTATSYTALLSDVIIEITSTSTLVTITLPAPSVVAAAGNKGKTYIIKDTSGAAFSKNITIVPTSGVIDGTGSVAISSNYGSIQVFCDGIAYYTQAPGTTLNSIPLSKASWNRQSSTQFTPGSTVVQMSFSSDAGSVPSNTGSRIDLSSLTQNELANINASQFQATITQSGTYQIIGNASFIWGANYNPVIQCVKNGTSVLTMGTCAVSASTAIETGSFVTTVELVVGDTIDFRANAPQAGGAPGFQFLALSFSITQVPGATSVVTTNALAQASWNRQSFTFFTPGSTVVQTSFASDPGTTPSNTGSRIDLNSLTLNYNSGLSISQFQVTVTQAGVYQIVGNMSALLIGSTIINAVIQCIKNGTTVLAMSVAQLVSPNPGLEAASFVVSAVFAVGDTIDFRVNTAQTTSFAFWALSLAISQLPTSVVSQVTAWNAVSGIAQALAPGNGYYVQNSALTSLTLPANVAVGTLISICGVGAGGWILLQNAGQSINFGNQVTTTGTTGSIASTNRYDGMDILCVVANTQWIVRAASGNLTVT